MNRTINPANGKRLRDLDLSIRTLHTAHSFGMHTLGDVASFEEKQLIRHGILKRELDELKEALENNGLKFFTKCDTDEGLRPGIGAEPTDGRSGTGMGQQIILTPVPLPELVSEIVRAVRADMNTAAAPQPEELLTRQETAKQLHVTLPTLRDYTRRGYLKGYRMGNRVLYKRNEVLNALQQNRTAKQANAWAK